MSTNLSEMPELVVADISILNNYPIVCVKVSDRDKVKEQTEVFVFLTAVIKNKSN